jgi:NAD(P)-dependent dehydrogenase (short-subunit alcohol dehydrogenase family)
MAPRFQLFPVPAYKVSKAALNMLTVQYAQSYENEGFTFITLSPGVSFFDANSSTTGELDVGS